MKQYPISNSHRRRNSVKETTIYFDLSIDDQFLGSGRLRP